MVLGYMTQFEKEVEKLYQELRYIWMYPDAKIIDKMEEFTIPSDTFDWTNIISFTIPRGYRGVIKNIGYDFWNVNDFNRTTWRLLINKQPYLDYDTLQTSEDQKDIIALQAGCELTIPLSSEDLVEFQVKKDVSGGPLNTLVNRIRGWMWVYGNDN